MKYAPLALAVWLMLWGIFSISNIKFEGQNLIMALLAFIAAALIMWERYNTPGTVA